MPKSLKLYIVVVVALGAFALVAATLLFFPPHPEIALGYDASSGSPSPARVFLGLAFWTFLSLVGPVLLVQLRRGNQAAVAIAPIMAALFLGGPAAGAWVAAIGTIELREIRGRIPWYGTLANHAGLVLPAVAAGLVLEV